MACALSLLTHFARFRSSSSERALELLAYKIAAIRGSGIEVKREVVVTAETFGENLLETALAFPCENVFEYTVLVLKAILGAARSAQHEVLFH